MNLLVTAGNTQTPIDKVRVITNIFTGRTGAAIARRAQERGHQVTLLTSHPGTAEGAPIEVRTYRTYDDLKREMAACVRRAGLEAIVHSAAVSDYAVSGAYSAPGGRRIVSGKIRSDSGELWLKLVRTRKLVDMIRNEWRFRGVLVKFKLEVGVSRARLLKRAEDSRLHSKADLMVANTLEGSGSWAYLGAGKEYRRIVRRNLPDRLLVEVERLHG